MTAQVLFFNVFSEKGSHLNAAEINCGMCFDNFWYFNTLFFFCLPWVKIELISIHKFSLNMLICKFQGVVVWNLLRKWKNFHIELKLEKLDISDFSTQHRFAQILNTFPNIVPIIIKTGMYLIIFYHYYTITIKQSIWGNNSRHKLL